MYPTFSLSSPDTQLSRFNVFAVVHYAAMSVEVQVGISSGS